MGLKTEAGKTAKQRQEEANVMQDGGDESRDEEEEKIPWKRREHVNHRSREKKGRGKAVAVF